MYFSLSLAEQIVDSFFGLATLPQQPKVYVRTDNRAADRVHSAYHRPGDIILDHDLFWIQHFAVVYWCSVKIGYHWLWLVSSVSSLP